MQSRVSILTHLLSQSRMANLSSRLTKLQKVRGSEDGYHGWHKGRKGRVKEITEVATGGSDKRMIDLCELVQISFFLIGL